MKPSRPFTTRIFLDGEKVLVHKSMARTWTGAVALAMQAVVLDKTADLDTLPMRIEVERG